MDIMHLIVVFLFLLMVSISLPVGARSISVCRDRNAHSIHDGPFDLSAEIAVGWS